MGNTLRLGGGVFLADKTGGPKRNQSDADERSSSEFGPSSRGGGEGSGRARKPGRVGKVSRNNSQQKCLTPTRKPLALTMASTKLNVLWGTDQCQLTSSPAHQLTSSPAHQRDHSRANSVSLMFEGIKRVASLQIRFFVLSLIFFESSVCGFGWLWAEDAVPIIGDAELLEQVRQAQADGTRRFPAGRMVASCRLRDEEVLRAEVVWRGDLARWDFDFVKHTSTGPLPAESKIIIRGQSEVIYYTPAKASVDRLSRDYAITHPPYLEYMLPDHWFSLQSLKPWHQLMQPDTHGNESLSAIKVSERNGIVQIVRDSPSGLGMVLEVSAVDGYMITRYDSRNQGPGVRFKGEASWIATGGPAPRLERLRWWRSDAQGKFSRDPNYDLRVHEFTPLSSVSDSQFSFSSLDLPRGTKITTINSQGRRVATTYRGGRTTPSLEDKLRESADGLRKGRLLNK